jgi:hypothetical protein
LKKSENTSIKENAMSGYSKTPLIKKIGIKEGCSLRTINAFHSFLSLISPIPDDCILQHSDDPKVDVLIWFCNSAKELESFMPAYMTQIEKHGMIWVCWYKKSSKKQKDVNEDLIRDTALELGMVDVKVCAVNDEWSGLKLVYRLENR